MQTSATFDRETGAQAFFKCENFQKVGAFKFRGACNAVALLSEEQRARGVITHSSGNHAQALALASVSGFTIDALDLSHNMLACAEKNIRRAGLGERIRTIHGDVHALPYSDGSVDVVVSRGSVFFWNAPDRAFAEIYRVLKPGGRTFIGGGFGSPALKAAIIARMQEKNPSFL